MIPKLLHQIWLGPRAAPARWIDTWPQMNPDFDHRVWNDDAIDTFGLHNEALYRRFIEAQIYDGAADVARWRSCTDAAASTSTPTPWLFGHCKTHRS